MKKTYHVEVHHEVLGWRKTPFAGGSRQFCLGWITCMDSMYPSEAMRIVATTTDGKTEVIRATPGRGKPHTN